MTDQISSQAIESLTSSQSVKISKDVNANSVSNALFSQISNGTVSLDLVTIDSAFGATPVAAPIAGKYEATPTTYADGDAVPFLTDANGRLQIGATSLNNDSVLVDDSAFTVGTSSVTAIGATYIAAGDVVQDGDIGAVRMTDDRLLYTQPFDGTNSMPMLDANTRAGFFQLTDGTDDLGILTIDSAYGATPTAVPIAGKYEATPTTYADGDATPLLTDTNGRQVIDIGAQSLTAVAVSKDNNANSSANPIFVEVVSGGVSTTEIIDYDTTADVASGASDNHDYTVNASKTLIVDYVWASSAQPLKVEVQAGPVASLATYAVKFSSASDPHVEFEFNNKLEVPDTSTGTLRVIRENIGRQTSDVYSTIAGNEV